MNFQQIFFNNLYKLEKDNAPSVGSFVWNHLKIPNGVKSILDVGCWRGDFLNSLPDSYEKTGVDTCEEPLKNVKARTIACSVENLPFDSKNFDLVTCFEVIEHLPQAIYVKALNEVERVSRKYIAVSVPNRQMLKQAFVKCQYCGCLFNPDYHLRAFNDDILKKLFKNFTLESCIECGPIISDYPSIVNFLVPLIGVKPKPNTICPQCGFSEGEIMYEKTHNYPAKNSVSNGLYTNIFSKVKSAIRQNHRPYCLLAFYRRNKN